MEIYDMHIHADEGKPDANALIGKMEAAGVTGGAVFSQDPDICASYDERISTLFDWVKGYRDRLFPVFWIHAREENAERKVEEAIAAGVVGFKMICTDYKVSDDCAQRLVEKITAAGRPIFFHSGILYDIKHEPTSQNNRPVEWESLLHIDRVRFSLAHCSWPWVDECLAVLGKYRWVKWKDTELAGRVTHEMEMFIDTTPGAPPAWREDLFRKLAAWDPNAESTMFGTDRYTSTYRIPKTVAQIEGDTALYRRFGASDTTLQNYFRDTFFRFLRLDGQGAG